MKTKQMLRRMAAGGLAVLSLLMVPATTPLLMASAASQAQGPVQPRDARLERAFAREQREFAAQTRRFDHASTLLAKTQELVDKFKQQGKDVAGLEKALAQAKLDLAAARGLHNDAGTILTAHKGFNDKGEVTDNADARKTVLDAQKKMREAHRGMVKAGVELGQVVRKFRQDNKSKP